MACIFVAVSLRGVKVHHSPDGHCYGLISILVFVDGMRPALSRLPAQVTENGTKNDCFQFCIIIILRHTVHL